ncbi:MAG: InlB B-repeat-containing protein, partial [Clostridia bacterium]|nr:InlB B-repeat-containing protein [Clostridia bacterium]
MKKNSFLCLFLVLLFVCVLLASCTPHGGDITTDPITESELVTEAPETTEEVTEEVTEELTESETTEAETVTETPETTIECIIPDVPVNIYTPDGKTQTVIVKEGSSLSSAVFELVELPVSGNGVKVEHNGWEYSLTKDGERKTYDFAAPPVVTLDGIHIYPVLEYSYLVSFGAGEGAFPEGADTEFYVKSGEMIDPEKLLTRMPAKADNGEFTYLFLGFSLNGKDVVEFPITIDSPLSFTALYGMEKIEYTLLVHTEYGELIGGGKTKFVSGTQAEIEAVIESYSSYKPADVHVGNARYSFKEIKATREGREWTLELLWNREIVHYTLILDRADTSSIESITVEAGEKFKLPEEKRREDEVRYYDFVGWRDANGHLYNGGYELTVSGDVSFIAEFAPGARKVYTVVFDTEIGVFENGDSTVVLKGYYGDPLIPPIPVAESLIFGEVVYSFFGWGRELPATFGENASYTAVYTTPHAVYFLDFYIDGELYLRVPHYVGTKLEAPERPEFTKNKIFSGWNLPETMPAEGLAVEATTRDAQVIYMLDGEEILKNSAAVGSLVTLAAPAQKQGYTVSGWSTLDINIIEGNSFTMPEHDVCFSAVSTPNLHTVTYILDGVTVYTDSVRFGEIYTVRGIEVRTGYDFTGWQSASGVFEGEGSVIVIPDRDVIFTASFTPCTYAVNYFLDGELIYRDEYLYGAEVTLRPEEYQEGCSFFWSSAGVNISKGSFKMPACDVDIYGAFSDGDNTIIFIVDGDPYGTIGVRAGQTVDLRLIPTKQGYTFTGWTCDEVDVSE